MQSASSLAVMNSTGKLKGKEAGTGDSAKAKGYVRLVRLVGTVHCKGGEGTTKERPPHRCIPIECSLAHVLTGKVEPRGNGIRRHRKNVELLTFGHHRASQKQGDHTVFHTA